MKNFIFIVLLTCFLISKQDNINAGPMVGYSTKMEVALWIQTTTQSDVKFAYWDIDNPNQVFETDNFITDKEKGVRNLKRCLEITYTKLNLYRLMKQDSSLFDKKETIKVTFPFTVTPEVVNKLIKQNEKERIPFGLYI